MVGYILILIGILGIILPILPGWALIIPGLGMISPEFAEGFGKIFRRHKQHNNIVKTSVATGDFLLERIFTRKHKRRKPRLTKAQAFQKKYKKKKGFSFFR